MWVGRWMGGGWGGGMGEGDLSPVMCKSHELSE